MALLAKPFDITQKICRRIFAIKPSVFSHQDVNQILEVNTTAIDSLSDRVGAVIQGSLVDYIGRGEPVIAKNGVDDYTVTTEFKITDGFLYHKNVRFVIPETSFNLDADFTTVPIPYSIALVAKKTTVDFATDPVMAGIDGGGFPSAMASSDAIVWGDERLVEVSGAFPELSPGEEFICYICSLVYTDERYKATANDYTAAIVMDAPNKTRGFGNFIQEFYMGSHSPLDLFGAVSRLAYKIKDLHTKLESILTFTGPQSLAAYYFGAWVNPASSSNYGHYTKFPSKLVQLSGAVRISTTPAVNDVVMTLPAGVRPTRNEVFIVPQVSYSGAGGYGSAVIVITASTGAVIIGEILNSNGSTGVQLCLGGVSFNTL